jgi:hypothetical protein
MPGVEDIARQTVGLAQKQPVVLASNDAGSVLTPMLQHQQGVI